MLKILVTLSCAVLLSACASAPESDASPGKFKTQIRWTSYGIPHVKADDWAGMGYGFAYATATDGVCVIAHDVMTVNGDLSRFLGPENGNLQSDVFHRGLLTDDRLIEFSGKQSANEHEFSRGYTAGYNRYLHDHADDLPAACAGEPWMRAITEDDLVRLTMGVGIRYGLGWFQKDIANAKPPGVPLADVEAVSIADSNAFSHDPHHHSG